MTYANELVQFGRNFDFKGIMKKFPMSAAPMSR